MAIAKLNFTGRQKITQDHVLISVGHDPQNRARFSATLSLESYGFPSDARVFVEAYRQTTVMRFDFGTVLVTKPPANCILDEFDTVEEILFRVFVTAASGRSGVLLGRAEKIHPKTPDAGNDDRAPLLPVIPAELGDEIWRLDFSEQVYLLINRDLPDWRQTAADATFRALVYPAVIRQVLSQIVIVDDYSDSDEPDNWRSQWLNFCISELGMGPLPTELDAGIDWISGAAESFARKHALKTLFEADDHV